MTAGGSGSAGIRLNALSAGHRAPRDRFTGVVHSVFRRACNIEREDGGMLVLLAAELGNAPHGVRLETPAGFAFDRHIAAGHGVGCRAGVLRVGRSGLSVDLRDAPTWRVDLSRLCLDSRQPAVAVARRAARQALARSRDRAGPAGRRTLAEFAHERLDLLAAATEAYAEQEAETAVQRLIGTGVGLTPSGDDLAVGFVAGLWCTAGSSPRRAVFAARLAAAMCRAARTTNAISRAYLRHAAHGHVCEPLAELAVAIASAATEDAIHAAVDRAVAVGSSSGHEAVRGLLRGLGAWAAGSGSMAAIPESIRRPAVKGVGAMEPAHG